MQGLHGLLNRRSVIEAMAPVQVDVVQLETLQTGLDTVEDTLPAQAILVDVARRVQLCWDAWNLCAGCAADGTKDLWEPTLSWVELGIRKDRKR